MTVIENSLWVEKYRSKELDDYIGNDHIKKVFHKFIENGEINNIILYGLAGTGKTTAAKLLVNSIDCDYMIINASDENNIEVIRKKVKTFASSVSIKGLFKIVVLDEADGITPQAQKALRYLIEEYSSTTRFVLTCNYINNIIPALQSRCKPYEIIPPTKKQVVERMQYILDSEKIKYVPDDVKALVDINFPDIRACIESMQQDVFMGEFSINKNNIVASDYCAKLLSIIQDKKRTDFDSSFVDIKTILVNSKSVSFTELYSFMYNNVEKLENIAASIETIAEMQYWSNFAADKEIVAMTLIYKLFDINRK